MYTPGKGRGRDHLVTVHIPVNPVPCPRPRLTRGGFVYYPKTYRDYKAAAIKHVPELDVEWDFPLAVHCDFVVCRPKKPTYDYPSRGDLDNFTKTAWDLITTAPGYWKDDRQIVVSTERKRWTKPGEEPHTRIEIYRYKP